MKLLAIFFVTAVIAQVVSANTAPEVKIVEKVQPTTSNPSQGTKPAMKNYLQLVKICVNQSSITQEKLKKIQKGDFSSPMKEEKRYIACMLKKLVIQSDDDNFYKAGVKAVSDGILTPEMEVALEDCSKNARTSRTTEERAFIFSKCYSQAVPGVKII